MEDLANQLRHTATPSWLTRDAFDVRSAVKTQPAPQRSTRSAGGIRTGVNSQALTAGPPDT